MGNLENMDVEDFVDVLGCEFYTGVPDSQLKALKASNVA